MKKRSFAPLTSFILAILFTILLATSTAFARCGCVCAMLCDNRCEFQCSGCGVNDCVDAAVSCCAQAQDAIGDSGPCTPENF